LPSALERLSMTITIINKFYKSARVRTDPRFNVMLTVVAHRADLVPPQPSSADVAKPVINDQSPRK
jgi:hypothetical protein